MFPAVPHLTAAFRACCPGLLVAAPPPHSILHDNRRAKVFARDLGLLGSLREFGSPGRDLVTCLIGLCARFFFFVTPRNGIDCGWSIHFFPAREFFIFFSLIFSAV